MSLQNILERKIISCSPQTPVMDVARLMETENVGCVLVLRGGIPEGIVTDRDIVLNCIVKGVDCAATPIQEVMTDEVYTATVDQGLFDVVRIMREKKVRRVPIVDDRGKAIGLLSFADVYQLLANEISSLLGPMEPEIPKIVSQAA